MKHVLRNLVLCALFGVLMTTTGCQPSPDFDEATVAADVSAAAESIARDLGARGPIAWLDHFDAGDDFGMASDGQLVFPYYETAESFVRDFAPTIRDMQLTWVDMRIDVIDRDHANIRSAYRESLVDTSGTTVAFGGYFTAFATRSAGMWQLRNVHWSSPAVVQAGSP